MAVYITVSDIKNRHIKKFPATEKTDYVDSANAWFDTYAQSIGVAPADVLLPVQANVKSFILSYMYMEFARDSIGADGTPPAGGGEGSLYESIYAHAKDQYKLLKAQIVDTALLQTNISRSASAVNWGSLERG